MGFLDQIYTILGLNKGGGQAKKKRGKQSFTPTGMDQGGAGVVLLAELEGARGAADGLAEILEETDNLVIDRVTRPVKLPAGGTLAQRLTVAADVGRKLLSNSDGDLLVFGEGGEDGMALRFVQAKPSADGSGFGLGDVLELPLSLDGDLAAIFRAVTVAALSPGRDRGRYVDLQVQTTDRIGNLVAQPPVGLNDRQTSSLLVALGHVCALRAKTEKRGGDAWANRSTEAYSKAASLLDPSGNPLQWAIAKTHHATALLASGEAARDDGLQEQAAAAFREIATHLNAEEYPTDWALAQTRLGSTLYKLAARNGDTKQLKEAAGAFEAAMTIQTRDAAAAAWAEIMNQYGVCLLALGQQVQGTKILDQSAAAFRAALEVRRRETLPLLWAQTANNLGAAAFALSKRGGAESLLAEAEACFEGAREVFLENGKARMVSVIDKNLDRVRARIAKKAT
ncbi:MAG: hypothetical protein ACPGOV_01490 [Magnetovibrionaceae bacterium]